MTPSPSSLRAFAHRFLVALVVSSLLAISLVLAAFHIGNAKINGIATASIDPRLLRAGGNYLIIGSDTRAFVKSAADAQHFGTAQSQSGQRSDTIMVAHLDPGKRTGILVSFPRDLWVAIPGHGTAKINAAFSYGGPALTIATIEQDFGVPISHYLEVDFAGFRNIVNAIGSVPIYFPTPARDKNTGLDIGRSGCQHLSGDQALQYVRSRYYQYYANGQWQYDPTSDLGRIRRQQYFVRSLAQAVVHSLTRTPWRFNKVVDKTVESLTRDSELGASDLRDLVRAFRNTAPNAFPMYTLPATNAFRDSQSVLLLDDALAAPTLAHLRATKPLGPVPKIPPSSVRVEVQNGSGVAGEAGRATSDLGARGFTIAAQATDADRSDYPVTEVRYRGGAAEQARLVLAYLGGAGRLLPGAVPAGAQVLVILGQDFQQVVPPSSSAPTTAHATRPAGASGGSGASGATTTTGPAANPGGAMPFAGC